MVEEYLAIVFLLLFTMKPVGPDFARLQFEAL